MAELTETQKKINELYETNFGRGASFGTTGGADYWADKVDNENLSWEDLGNMLHGSDEGKKHRGEVEGYTKGNVYIGGIDPTRSIESQSGPGFWGDHFREGGVFEHMNAAAKADAIAKDVNHTPAEAYFNNTLGGTDKSISEKDTIENITKIIDNTKDIDTSGFLKTGDLDAWWKGLDKPWEKDQKSGGMDDFMKFMMFMSMMRPQGGGGYGGSQYGYGGLNPGGVMSAYNPLDNITSAISAFQSLPGIGTGNVNTGNAAAA